MNMEPEKENSQLAFRASYGSNINAKGYPFELGEFGAITSAAFYHKSGFFADATGYWSNQYDPGYYLTVASAGYMSTALKKWSFLIEYNRYFYHIEQETLPVSIIYTYNDNYSSQSFKNCFAGGIYFEHLNFIFKFGYSLYTGDRTGHRFNPTLSYSFEKRNWHGIDRISILPTFSVLMGIEQIPYYKKLFQSRLEAIYRIRRGLPLYSEELSSEFGVMNYALRLPISISHKNWSFMLSYTYNFPKRLPGESASISDGGSLSINVVRYIDLKARWKCFKVSLYRLIFFLILSYGDQTRYSEDNLR